MAEPTDAEIAAARATLARSSRILQVMGPQTSGSAHAQNLTKVIVPKLVDGKFHFWRCRMMDILMEYDLY